MNAPATQVVTAPTQAPSLVARFASKFGVEPNRMLDSLKATAFHTDGKEVSNEQMMALLIVADQYGLNPWTRELYAFPDSKKGGIVPIVSIDGWTRILNERPELQGIEFEYGPDAENAKFKGAPAWIDCIIHRADRVKPIRVRERLNECYRDTGPWNSHPGRMLRHKALMQGARVAFGFAGIYDPDEGERIIEGQVVSSAGPTAPAIADINATVSGGGGAKVAPAPAPESAPGGTAQANEPISPERPTLSYAHVRAKLDAAKTRDALDEAAAEIALVVSVKHQAELTELYKAAVAALEE